MNSLAVNHSVSVGSCRWPTLHTTTIGLACAEVAERPILKRYPISMSDWLRIRRAHRNITLIWCVAPKRQSLSSEDSQHGESHNGQITRRIWLSHSTFYACMRTLLPNQTDVCHLIIIDRMMMILPVSRTYAYRFFFKINIKNRRRRTRNINGIASVNEMQQPTGKKNKK